MTTVGLETVSPSAEPTALAGGQIVGTPEDADEAPDTLDLAANLGAVVVATAMVADIATTARALMMVMKVFFMFGPPR
jgi:multisubunit Na+/H+ antiporter MnhC subunit